MESLGHPPFSVLWHDGIGLNKNRYDDKQNKNHLGTQTAH